MGLEQLMQHMHISVIAAVILLILISPVKYNIKKGEHVHPFASQPEICPSKTQVHKVGSQQHAWHSQPGDGISSRVLVHPTSAEPTLQLTDNTPASFPLCFLFWPPRPVPHLLQDPALCPGGPQSCSHSALDCCPVMAMPAQLVLAK